MARRMYVSVKGLKRTIRNLKKVDAKIQGPVRKKMLSEMGQKTKYYAQQKIGEISLTGGLLKDLHYRVFPDRVSIFVGAGHSAMGYSWDRGMTHWVSRRMVSQSGYTVDDWMNARGFNPRVKGFMAGRGTKIGRGIQYMDYATQRLSKAMPNLLNKYSKMIVK